MANQNVKKQNTSVNYAREAATSAVRAAGSEAGKAAAKAVISGAAKRAVKTAIRKIGMSVPTFNHPEWYTNDTTAKLVGLNFAANKSVKYTPFNTYMGESSEYKTSIPSVVSITTADLPAYDPSDHDGWTAGIAQIRNALAAANNASASYDTRDLERYVIHVVHMHVLASSAQRLLGVINHFDGMDTSVPRTYASVLGFDYASLVLESANLRTALQQLVTYIATAAPLKCDLIERKRWLYGNVFLDSEGPKATPIFITPRFTARCSASGEPAVLPIGNFESARADVSDLITAIRVAMFNFSRYSTFAIIAGDMIKAYGREGFYPDEDVTSYESTKLEPIYDRAVLDQISNGIVVGRADVTYHATDESIAAGFRIAGEDPTRALDYGLATEQSSKFIINAHDDEITSGETMSLTRFTCGLALGPGDNDATVKWRNSEVLMSVYFAVPVSTGDALHTYADANHALVTRMHSSMFMWQLNPTVNDGWFGAIPTYWSAVNGLPAVYMLFGSVTGGLLQTTSLRHVDTFAYTTDEVIRSMGYTANKSLLNIPIRLRIAKTEVL